MKKLLTLTCICSMLFTSVIFAKELTVMFHDAPIPYVQKPMIKNGTTFVPMKQTLETLGVDVSWNAPTKTVIGKKGDIIVSTCPNSTTLIVTTGEKTQRIPLDVPTYIENDTIFVPLRPLLQPFQAEIIWDSNTNAVQIKSKDNDSFVVKKTEQKTIKNKDGVTVWKAEIHYPELQVESEAIAKINEVIANDVFTSLSATENEVSAENIVVSDSGVPYSFDCNYEITYLDNNTISILLDYYEFTGGAHGMPFRQAYTFDLNTGTQLQLKDIMDMSEADIVTFVKEAFKKNIKQNRDNYFAGAEEIVDSEYFVYDFYIQPNKIVFFTQTYLLEPYANHYQPTIVDTQDITLKIDIHKSL